MIFILNLAIVLLAVYNIVIYHLSLPAGRQACTVIRQLAELKYQDSARMLRRVTQPPHIGKADDPDHVWPENIDHLASDLNVCYHAVYVTFSFTNQDWSRSPVYASDRQKRWVTVIIFFFKFFYFLCTPLEQSWCEFLPILSKRITLFNPRILYERIIIFINYTIHKQNALD